MLSPLAIWRCVWLSVVRAPTATQEIRFRQVLRGDRVQELRARRQAEVADLDQQLARPAQAGGDIETRPSRSGS